MIPAGSSPHLEDSGLGVSRFDLPCGRQTGDDTAAIVRRWGHDRALTADTVDDLCVLARTALAPGTRVASSVCVRLRWADLDHVRVDLEWHGLRGDLPDEVADEALRATAPVMDTRAERWGVERGATPGQWMIVDTRSSQRRPDRPPPG